MPCEASLLFDADCLHLQFEPSLVKKVEDKTAPQNKRPARKANVCMPLWISVGCHADMDSPKSPRQAWPRRNQVDGIEVRQDHERYDLSRV